ncbi:hypothetical protein BJX76DRAFT_10615 [Aspergillus varians]
MQSGKPQGINPYLSRCSCATGTLETNIDDRANGSILVKTNTQTVQDGQQSCSHQARTGQIGILNRSTGPGKEGNNGRKGREIIHNVSESGRLPPCLAGEQIIREGEEDLKYSRSREAQQVAVLGWGDKTRRYLAGLPCDWSWGERSATLRYSVRPVNETRERKFFLLRNGCCTAVKLYSVPTLACVRWRSEAAFCPGGVSGDVKSYILLVVFEE